MSLYTVTYWIGKVGQGEGIGKVYQLVEVEKHLL